MAKPKSEHITLDLSGTRISYDSPLSYSKRYPRSPANVQTQYRINIHDQDLYKKQHEYTKSKNLHAIRKSYWDYGRSLIWGTVKGTLSMSVSLYRTLQPEFDAQDPTAFIKALQADYEEIYGKKDRKKKYNYKNIAPENYQIKILSGISWGYYEYSAGGDISVIYAYPLSDQHYFKVQFSFTSHSEDQKDKWELQAQATIDFIMASFEVK